MPRVPFIGLTGGIGAGKSTALEALERLGAATISADVVVHRLYEEPESLFVAQFLGESNALAATVEHRDGGHCAVTLAGGEKIVATAVGACAAGGVFPPTSGVGVGVGVAVAVGTAIGSPVSYASPLKAWLAAG